MPERGPSRYQLVRERLLAGDVLTIKDVERDFGLHRSSLARIVQVMREEGYQFREERSGPTIPVAYRITGQQAKGDRPNRSQLIKERLLAGETLDRTVTREYGVDGSIFTKCVRELRNDGHVFHEVKQKSNKPIRYQLASAASATTTNQPTKQTPRYSGPSTKTTNQPMNQPTGNGRVSKSSSPSALAAELLLAGEHLSGADVVERFPGAKGQSIGVAIARLKMQGYEFDFEREDGTGAKRWFITGKGEPRQRAAPGTRSLAVGSSRNGYRPKMPTPQVDAPTECVMAFRVTDDEVQFAVRQGGRVFTAQVLSVAEAE